MYTSGVFIVKKGREDEFARRWQQSADSSISEFPDITFMLFRDAVNPAALSQPGRGLAQRRADRSRTQHSGVPGRDGRGLAHARLRRDRDAQAGRRGQLSAPRAKGQKGSGTAGQGNLTQI